MNRLKSENGSTLMLVVITVAILTLLGTALLSMSLMNINMKSNDTRVKSTQYYAETGIDQIYAKIGKVVEGSIDDAIVATHYDLNGDGTSANIGLLGDIRTYINTGTVNPGRSGSELEGYTKTVSGKKVIDPNAINTFAETQYRSHFRSSMNVEISKNDGSSIVDDIIEDITDASSYIKVDAGAGSTISVRMTGIIPFSGDGSQLIFENVEVRYRLADNTEKIITTDIVVSDSLASYPLLTYEKRTKILDNPLWQQPLVANNNIEFVNTSTSSITVDGNIFGYGTTPADAANANSLSYGGVISEGASNVTVNGNIISRAYVQVKEGPSSSNNAQLIVNKGHIYANSVAVQKGSTGDIKVVDGNVYTSDDLELNGNGGSIDITGSYYGYTDGSSKGLTHDASSAIIVNADLSNPGTRLNISGMPTGDAPYTEAHDGILIGGTAYVDVTGNRYQTAESVSLKGNYIAYLFGFEKNPHIDQIQADNFFAGGLYNYYPLNDADADPNNDHDVVVENKLWKDNLVKVNYNTFDFANGSTVYDIDPGDPLDELYSITDRKAYFAGFKEYLQTYTPGTGYQNLKTGNGTNISLGNGNTGGASQGRYIYTTGIKIDRDKDFHGGAFDFLDLVYRNGDSTNKIGVGVYDTFKVELADDYLWWLHKMRFKDTDTSSVAIEEPVTGTSPTIQNINILSKYSKMEDVGGTVRYPSTASNPTASVIGTVGDSLFGNGVAADIVKFVGKNSAQTLHIYNVSSPEVAGDYVLKLNANAQGVIAHSGDIVIHDSLNFAGPIISNGSIKVEGDNCRFLNTGQDVKDYFAEFIYKDDYLYDFFNVQRFGNGASPNVYMNEMEYISIDTSGNAYDVNNNSIFDYKDLISFKYWTVSK